LEEMNPGYVPKGLEVRTRKKVQQFLGTFGSDQVGIDDRDAVDARVEHCKAPSGLWRVVAGGSGGRN
jgi:hypothetical protein